MSSSITAARPRALLLGAAMLLSQHLPAFEMPPKNPFLADSNYAMAHGDSAQQDAMPQAGPFGPSRTLREAERQYVPTGPGFFGINTSGVYADGRRVFWGNGLDRIVKIDYDTHELIAEYFFPNVQRWSEEQADASIARFDASNSGPIAAPGLGE